MFSNGILALAGTSIVVILATEGKVDRLIPLYAVGVFTSFTLSQTGMARYHLRRKEDGWKTGLFVNGFGAFLTFVVDIIIAIVKFTHGAWVIIVIVPILVAAAAAPQQAVHRTRPTSSSKTRARRRRSCAGTSCSCSSTPSTSRRPARSSTRARSRPTRCAPCTSRST